MTHITPSGDGSEGRGEPAAPARPAGAGETPPPPGNPFAPFVALFAAIGNALLDIEAAISHAFGQPSRTEYRAMERYIADRIRIGELESRGMPGIGPLSIKEPFRIGKFADGAPIVMRPPPVPPLETRPDTPGKSDH